MQSENYKNFFGDFNIYNYVTLICFCQAVIGKLQGKFRTKVVKVSDQRVGAKFYIP